MAEKLIYEPEKESELPDPDEIPIKDRKVITESYDLVVKSLMDQIKGDVIFLKPLSERPSFQRGYVWTDTLASRLIESILLNVPIPPCYFSQNDNFELDVIDGQQRLFSIFRFIENQFSLRNLEILKELNGLRFHEIPPNLKRKLETHTIRCVLISNESHPEIKFDVFERLNTNTVPLNAQELRNCIYRGSLNSLLKEEVFYEPWLTVLGKKHPDKRMRDEELVLRFFAFHHKGLSTYRTPLKHWLNEMAKEGRSFNENKIGRMRTAWRHSVDISLIWFEPEECFRRYTERKKGPVNRALFDLVMASASQTTPEIAARSRNKIRKAYEDLLQDENFSDLISRAVDHTKRTKSRFEIWNTKIQNILK